MRDPEAKILVDAPYMSNRKELPVKALSRDSLKYGYSPRKESMYVVCLVSKVKGFWVDKSNV